MGGNKKVVSLKNEIIFALKEIKDKYPRILPDDIEMFAPIYYPVALLEMNLDEITFEDFESVQLTVLKLISLGQKEHKIIADLTGLSPNYVYKIKHLLRGYGHIDDNGITKLGQKSLLQEKKIIKSCVWQKFQVDALNGCLIKMDSSVSESMLNSTDETHIIVGHLDYLDGITVESISNQLQKKNYLDFIRQKNGVLHTNVQSINEVRCTEVKYTQCFIVKLKHTVEPIVFAKRYDESKKIIRDRFSWKPFSIHNEMLRGKYDFEEDIPISNDMAKQYILHSYYMIKQQSEKVNMIEKIPHTLRKVYPFKEEGITIGHKQEGVHMIDVHETALQKYTSWLPYFMMELDRYGKYLLTNESLYGNIIHLSTNSKRLKEVCKLLNAKVEASEDRTKFLSILKDKLRSIPENSFLMDEIEKVLIEIER